MYEKGNGQSVLRRYAHDSGLFGIQCVNPSVGRVAVAIGRDSVDNRCRSDGNCDGCPGPSRVDPKRSRKAL